MVNLRVGIAGLGHMGSLHLLSCLKMNPEVKVICVAEPNRRNQRRALTLGVDVCGDFQNLIDRGDLDCIIISLPNFLKAEAVSYAAENGLDIFLDKPMGRTLEEAYKIAQEVKKCGVRLMVGSNYRYFPSVKKIKNNFEEGRIGDVHLANFELVMNGPLSHPLHPSPVPKWWLDPELAGGGVLIDLGHHLIDSCNWFFGKSEVLFSQIQHIFNFSVEDTATVVLRSTDTGVVSTLNMGWFSKMIFPEFNFRVNLHGSAGFLSTDKYAPRNMRIHAVKEGLKNVIKRLLLRRINYLSYTYYYASYFDIIKDFFTAIKEGTEAPITVQEELDVMSIIDQIYFSHKRARDR